MAGALWLIDDAVRETMLFAAVGLLAGGVDDLLVDLVYLFRRLIGKQSAPVAIADLPMPLAAPPLAILIAAWQEEAVIGAMLTTALERLRYPDFSIHVGVYPNDYPTIDAVAAIAERDPRVRIVVGPDDGPTTKAANLNAVWQALDCEAAVTGRRPAAIILHDAEDVVDADELTVFASYLQHHDVVQVPVVPLEVAGSPLMSGHYLDEFAEAHRKLLPVRTAIGAAMPLAGTGCAIATAVLDRIGAGRGGRPFDPDSLTEDYELGLTIAAMGGRGVFARVVSDERRLVAVRAFFPATLTAAVRQKARWMTGIALAGWDRTGWGRPLAIGDHWMRLRDRRGPLSVLILACAYLAILGWGASLGLHALDPAAPGAAALPAGWLLAVNSALLGWRLAMRAAFTGAAYGRRDALLALPRFFVGNIVSLMAAPRALSRYISMLRGRRPVWDKTRHFFPDALVEPS